LGGFGFVVVVGRRRRPIRRSDSGSKRWTRTAFTAQDSTLLFVVSRSFEVTSFQTFEFKRWTTRYDNEYGLSSSSSSSDGE
jgi:hypothetical protein